MMDEEIARKMNDMNIKYSLPVEMKVKKRGFKCGKRDRGWV